MQLRGRAREALARAVNGTAKVGRTPMDRVQVIKRLEKTAEISYYQIMEAEIEKATKGGNL